MSKPKLRALVFFAALSWMMLNPFLREAIGLETPWLRDWAMMGTLGIPLYDARYYRVQSVWQPLPYASLLPPSSRPYAPALRSDADVVRLGKRLCAQLGPTADVRVVTRRGTKYGWVPERRGEGNLCAP